MPPPLAPHSISPLMGPASGRHSLRVSPKVLAALVSYLLSGSSLGTDRVGQLADSKGMGKVPSPPRAPRISPE